MAVEHHSMIVVRARVRSRRGSGCPVAIGVAYGNDLDIIESKKILSVAAGNAAGTYESDPSCQTLAPSLSRIPEGAIAGPGQAGSRDRFNSRL
jgi:hypothetical protein